MSDAGLRGTTTDDGVCLVVTCHDPLGRFASGIADAGEALAEVFTSIAVNVTAETDQRTTDALRALDLPVVVGVHGAGTIGIGTARKDALALGLRCESAWLFHSDLDHVLCWITTARAEVERCTADRAYDLVVVGRSVEAMAAGPERLRATEEIVNHVYGLANGIVGRWDLMIAMRLMSRDTARTIVEHSRDPTITNDVTWPMLVASRGGSVGWFAADGIRFRARDDFGSVADRRDDDPREWHGRMVTATAHIRAIVDFEAS